MALLQNGYFIQAIGFVAFGLGVYSFLQKDDRKLKLLLAGQCVMLAIHFTLLGAHGGAAMTAIGAVRNVLASRGTERLKPLALVFIAVYIAAGIIRYEEWVDALPVISSCVATFGLFRLKGIRMRLCFVLGSTLWLVHNTLVGSIGPALMEAVMLCATLRTIYYLHKEKTP